MKISTMVLILFFMMIFQCGTNSSTNQQSSIVISSLTIFIDDGGESDPCADTLRYRATFKTNINATARVYWGRSSGIYTDSLTSSAPERTQFDFTLYPVLANQRYYIKIIAFASAKDTASLDEETFIAEKGSGAIPSIDSLQTKQGTTYALIYMRLSSPAKPKIFYGLSANYTDSIIITQSKTTHYQRIDGLTPETVYHYGIALEDNCGNFVTPAWDSLFRTNPLPKIYFLPDTIISEGDTVDIDVYCENIIDLFAVRFQFYFPTQSLSYLSMDKGELASNSAYNSIHFLNWPNIQGTDGKAGNVTDWTIKYIGYVYPWGTYMQLPLNTPGKIATFHFRKLQTGEGELRFETLQLLFQDCILAPIEVISYDAHIIIR